MDILTVNDQDGQYPNSWYAATATPPGPFPAAVGALNCDICIVGAGFTGLSAALHLAERGYDVILLDAQRVGFGASGRNGGQVGTGHRMEQDALEKAVGQKRAHELWDLSLESVQLVRDLCAVHNIDTAIVDGIIHADHRARYVAESHEYARKLQDDYGYEHITCLTKTEMQEHVGSAAYFGGTLDMGGAHIHPLRFAFGMAGAAEKAGARIFEKSRVTTLSQGNPNRVQTDAAEISAEYVVLACNGYLGGLDNGVASRVMPINSFVAATEPLSEDLARSLIRDNHAVADSKFVVNYFRLSEDRRMIFGGGESYGYKFPTDVAAKVRKPMSEIFPQLAKTSIDYAWGGTLGITMNRMPDFARLGAHVLSLSGYSGHGVALATLGGKLAADAIAGQAEKFDIICEFPTPRFPGGSALRTPLLVLGMVWFSLRDKL